METSIVIQYLAKISSIFTLKCCIDDRSVVLGFLQAQPQRGREDVQPDMLQGQKVWDHSELSQQL